MGYGGGADMAPIGRSSGGWRLLRPKNRCLITRHPFNSIYCSIAYVFQFVQNYQLSRRAFFSGGYHIYLILHNDLCPHAAGSMG